ncbi:MAG: quinone oxidoreductase [Gemmatimonadota bacterium]
MTGPLRTVAVRVHEPGGPDALVVEGLEVPAPGPGQIRLVHEAIGLNFIDTYHRTGLYPLALPAIIGSEGAGVVDAVGEGVTDLAVGDPVAYGQSLGAYAGARLIGAERVVGLPDHVSAELAAAAMLKGLTAWYLVRRTHQVAPGQTVLVHAAAGGVGSLLCQWASALGARVLGTAGSAEKAARARGAGCDEVILYRHEDVAGAVMEHTGGRGVDVVYDGVGAATFEASLASLAPFGLMASFGNSSGPVPPIRLLSLKDRGLYLTRPTLGSHIGTREGLERGASELFTALADGTLSVTIGRRFRLEEAAAAHRALEARETVGSTLLMP